MPEIDQQSADAALAIKALTSLSSVTPSSTSPHNSRPPPPNVSSPNKTISNPSPLRNPSETTPTAKLETTHLSLKHSNAAGSDSSSQKSTSVDSLANNDSLTAKKLSASLLSSSTSSATPGKLIISTNLPSDKPSYSVPSYTTSLTSALSSNLEKQIPLSSKPSSPKLLSKTSTSDKKQTFSTNKAEEHEIYSIDAGVIRCICGFTHDDGFTIQCEKCNAWQHAVCVNIENDQVPEVYFCDRCGKLSYDVNAAKAYQIRRLKELKAQADLVRSLEDEDSSRLKSKKRNSTDFDANSDDDTLPKRRRSQDEVKRGNNNSSNNTERSSSFLPSPRVSSSRSSPSPLASASMTAISTTITGNRRGRTKRLTVPTDLPASVKDDENDNEPEKKFTLAQMYSSYFVPISVNRFATPAVRKYTENIPSNLNEDQNEITHFSATKYQNIKLPDVTVKLTSDHPKQKFSGFSRFGLFLENSVPRDRYLINYVGQVMTLEQYKSNPVNQYRQFGCPKPGVLFHPLLQICVDARLVGSKARFIRRSCRPNCKISTVVVDKTEVKFAAFSTESIEAGSELTIAWEWDQKHPARKLIDGVPPDQLTKQEKLFLEHVAEMANQRGAECACNLPAGECILARMKKINGAPPRTTRMSNKSRRGNDSGDNDGNSGVYGTEMTDSATFYSKREARKLQSAMELIERVSRNVESKKRKKEESKEPESTSPAEPLAPSLSSDTEIKETKKSLIAFVDKAIQTSPITIPLRHYSEPRKKETLNGSTKYGTILPRAIQKKRLFAQYLQAKKSFEKRPKTEKGNGYSTVSTKPSSGSINNSSKGTTTSRLSTIIKVPNGSVGATVSGGGTVEVFNSLPTSSPHLPSDGLSSQGTSKTPTPVPGSPTSLSTLENETKNNVSSAIAAPESKTTTINISPEVAVSSVSAPIPPATTTITSTTATTLIQNLIPSTTVSSTNNQGKTVKKLSFADYKKKKTNAQQK